MKKYDVIIIGSGISGLTLGILLAMEKKRVCILEQHSKPGGYMHCFERFGHQFETGAHYVGGIKDGGSFNTILKYLNVFDSSDFLELSNSGHDVLQFPSFKVEFAPSYEQTISNLTNEFPGEAKAINEYFKLVKETVANFPSYSFLPEANFKNILNLVSCSLDSIVSKLTDNTRLKTAIYAYCSLHGVHPKVASFAFHAVLTDSLMQSAHTFSNGGDQLTNRFIDRLNSLGGKVLLNQKVIELEQENKNITQVKTINGEIFQADLVISAIHPKNLFKMITPMNLKKAFINRLDSITESSGAFAINTVLKDVSKFGPFKNYHYFSSDNSEHLFDNVIEANSNTPSILFVNCPNKNNTSCEHPVSIITNCSHEYFSKNIDQNYRQNEEYLNRKKIYESKIIEILHQREIILKNNILKKCSSTPLTNIRYNGSVNGSAYGIYHSIQNTGVRAIGPRTHYKNLLLTGQNTLFPGLLGAAISGIRTFGQIGDLKTLLKSLNDIRSSSL